MKNIGAENGSGIGVVLSSAIRTVYEQLQIACVEREIFV